MNISPSAMKIASRLFIALAVAAGFVTAGFEPLASAQSQTGFTYNGLAYTSYQATEYLETPQGPNSAADIAGIGANYATVLVTQYVQTYTSNTIAATSSTPTDAAVIAAITNLQSQGIKVVLKPHVDSLDGVWRGNFAPTDPAAWFASYQTFIVHYAQIAAAQGVDIMVVGCELKTLSGSTYESNWSSIITAVRAVFSGPLAYAANATSAGDEFSSVSFWGKLDIIGLDGYVPLTNHADPTVAQLVAAWSNNKSGFDPLAAFKNLQSSYPTIPLIFTELGYTSTAGTNEAPFNYTPTGSYDPSEQANCYQAFFEVYSQQTTWMKGVFWWDWAVSPPSTADTGYTPQLKAAGNVLADWYGAPTFTLAPADSILTVTQGSNATDTIDITAANGFAGNVTLAVSGLPSGVTAAFGTNPATGSSVLTLTATGSATTGAATVTITGTSGDLSTMTTIALTVNPASTQSFTLTSSASSLAVADGGTGAATITVNPSGGFSGNVTLAATGLPSGVTASFGTNPATGTSLMTLAASNAAVPGQAAITITGTSGSLTASIPLLLTVLPAMQVPTTTSVVVSQVNWLAALTGYVQTSNNPTGGSFGVNAYGEIAVADTDNLHLIDAQTGVKTTLGSWSGASAVAVDSKSNIYVGTLYGAPESIVKLPYVGAAANNGYAPFATPTAALPTCTATGAVECLVPHVGSFYPEAMAFDAAGDMFWITEGNGTTAGFAGNSIYECSVACLGGTGSPVLLYTEPAATTAPSTASGQLVAGGLAVDASGNVFFTDSSVYVNASTYAYTSFYSDLDELPASTGTGFGGKTTGYAAAPTVLYTLTPASIGPYNNKLDGVAAASGTVYFADNNDGVFAFPNSGGAIAINSGQPAGLYAVSTQGAKTLSIDGQGNVYLADSSAAINTRSADTLAQLTIDNLTVPASAVGVAVSPSTTVNPITTILNDATCTGSPAPSATFTASASTTATATASTTGTCAATFSGGASFATTLSFTPAAEGVSSLSLNATDQAGNTEAVTVVGMGTGFVLSASPAALSVAQGSDATGTVTVIDDGGFSGAVSLAATGLPSGVTASFAAGPVIDTQVLTLTASGTAATGGPVTVTITGTSGSLTASTTVALTVTAAPSFTLSPSPGSVTVAQGGSGTSTVTVAPANGFAGSVTLAATGLPSGVTAAFATNPTTSSSVLTLTASNTATVGGPVSVTITGTSGSVTASTTVAVTVAAAPTFAIAPSAGAVSVTQGNTATDTITVTPSNGFNAGVTLSATGLPNGVTAAFAPNPTTTGSSVLTLTASNTATTGGPVTVTITGTSGSITETTTVALTVNVAPGFTLSPAASTVTVIQGSNATDTITVTDVGGFAGSVTLAATGLPTGVSAAFATNPTTGTSVLTLTASAAATTGAATVTITGTSGSLTASTTVALTVNVPASFTIAPSAPALSLTQGTSGTSTITVTGAGGFNGNVTLAATGLPSGVTPAFATNPTNGSSVLTLTASSTATVGTATVTITGTSGALTASTTISLTVVAAPIPSLAVAGTSLTVVAGNTGTSTIAVTPSGGFTGSVVLSTVITGPANAVDPPTLSFGTTSPVSITGTSPGTATLTIATTAPSSGGSCTSSNQMQRGVPWYAGGGAVLACLILFGIPTRRRSWRSMLGMLVLLVAFAGGMLACGGGGGGTTCTPTPANPGTTAGAYTITVTGTSGSITASGTVSLTVK